MQYSQIQRRRPGSGEQIPWHCEWRMAPAWVLPSLVMAGPCCARGRAIASALIVWRLFTSLSLSPEDVSSVTTQLSCSGMRMMGDDDARYDEATL